MTLNRLMFDNELFNFLNINSNNIISIILLNGDKNVLNTEFNYFVRKPNDNTFVSYIPTNKIHPNEDMNSIYFNHSKFLTEEKNRTPIRIGRLLTKLIKKESFETFNITNKDIEDFVNTYKSHFDFDEKKLQIVSSKEIKTWYLESNYLSVYSGTLWKSCMRQPERNKFLNLYTENSTCKMLILLDDNQKLRARALLWEDVTNVFSGEKYKVMDRIYTIYDHDVNLFKYWAKNNGYITKTYQNSKSDNIFDVDGNIIEMNLAINLEKSDFNYYPYLDSFKFFNKRSHMLYNYNKNHECYKLTRSDGYLPEDEINSDEFFDVDELFVDED